MTASIKSFSPISAEYAKPYDARIHVDTVADLTSALTKFNYENMLVFVKSEKKLYYLKDDMDGSETTHWSAFEMADITFSEYVPDTKAYTIGQPVYLGSDIFICVVDAAAGEDPINYPDKWVQIGATKFLAFNFTAQTDFTVDHAIEAPTLTLWNNDNEIIEADIEYVSATQFRIKATPAITGHGYVK